MQQPHQALQLQSSTRLHSFRARRSGSGRLRCYCTAQTREIELVRFRDGSSFSPIINGTWQLAGGHGRAVFDQVFDRLRPHAEAGLTSFDTADIYGPSEEILGKLQRKWREEGKPPLQLFTKYVPNLNYGPPDSQAVQKAIRRSLSMLQVDRLDLVQLHWWDYRIPGLVDTMQRLAELQAEGLVNSLGVTNLDTVHVEQITDAGISLVSNQVQFSLLDRRPRGPNGMLQLCKERGIKLLCYGVVGGGLLTDRYLEKGESPLFSGSSLRAVELDTSSLKMYWNVVRQFGGEETWRRLLHVLREVADKHQTSVSCVALRWVIQQGGGSIAYPIIGIRSARHIASNIAALSLALEQEDLEYIEEALKRAQGPTGDIYSFERARM